jgi:hypothetical protein
MQCPKKSIVAVMVKREIFKKEGDELLSNWNELLAFDF